MGTLRKYFKSNVINLIRGWGFFRLPQTASGAIQELASFGKNSEIMDPIVGIINPKYLHVGNNVTVLPYARIAACDSYDKAGEKFEPVIRIGDGCQINTFFSLQCHTRVEIGKKVLIAPRVTITDISHKYENPNKAIMDQGLVEGGAVKIGDGCYIGAGVIILPGVEIGPNSVIGAGAVVTKSIPAFCVAVGNPARVVKQLDKLTGSWMRVDKETSNENIIC